jgi:aspartate carbamoyltransferase catalytic subunit
LPGQPPDELATVLAVEPVQNTMCGRENHPRDGVKKAWRKSFGAPANSVGLGELRMKLYHVIEAQQFDVPTLQELFDATAQMERLAKRGGGSEYQNRVMATLFYEPSTRTRFSFEAAMHRLGGRVITTENAAEFSSVSKGETLEDTIRIINGYADVVVIRHYEVGAARRAAAVSRVPVINAGDGVGQHPTQALLDLYTIRKETGSIDGLKIAMVGDLAQGRTARSLAYLLAKFKGIRAFFVAPPLLRMKEDILHHLREHGVEFVEETNLEKVLPEVDVVYQTRIQKERFGDRVADYEQCRGLYVINQASLNLMKRNAILMHPLPRIDEIAMEVDSDPRAAYFRQAQNGLYVRMALLSMVLSNCPALGS